MSWETKYPNFGVVRVEGSNVRVYYDQHNYITINTGQNIMQATWSGGELNITLADGRVRRYRDQHNYITI